MHAITVLNLSGLPGLAKFQLFLEIWGLWKFGKLGSFKIFGLIQFKKSSLGSGGSEEIDNVVPKGQSRDTLCSNAGIKTDNFGF